MSRISGVAGSGIGIGSSGLGETAKLQKTDGLFNGLKVSKANANGESPASRMAGADAVKNMAAPQDLMGMLKQVVDLLGKLTKMMATLQQMQGTSSGNSAGNAASSAASNSATGSASPAAKSADNSLLTAPFITAEQLKGISDPEAFFKARNEALFPPTSAKVVNILDGSSQPLNQKQLATPQQAADISKYLSNLTGKDFPVNEIQYKTGPFSQDYGNDPRRQLQVGNLNVGLVMQLYANNPKEVADQMILAQMKDYSSKVPDYN